VAAVGYLASSLAKQNLWCITNHASLPGAQGINISFNLHQDKLVQSTALVTIIHLT